MIVDRPPAVTARRTWLPVQRPAWVTAAHVGVVDEPVQRVRVGIGGRIKCNALLAELLQPHRIDAATQGRRDPRRTANRCTGIAALRVLRRLAARNTRLPEHLLQIGRPELVHLLMRVLARIGWTCRHAALVVDHHRTMHIAYADRRFARDKPGPTALRTPLVRQLAARETDLHAFELGRSGPERFVPLPTFGFHSID